MSSCPGNSTYSIAVNMTPFGHKWTIQRAKRFARHLHTLHRVKWLCMNIIYIDKKNKPDRVCDCHGSTNDIMLAVYWRNESGSPWRSIDWLWEQYNRVGSVWQKAKWGRHVEPHSIEPNISYHNRKWQRHFQRGKKNCNMRRALVQLLHVIWKLNNFIWQRSLPCGHRATEAAGINPVLLARFSRMK